MYTEKWEFIEQMNFFIYILKSFLSRRRHQEYETLMYQTFYTYSTVKEENIKNLHRYNKLICNDKCL